MLIGYVSINEVYQIPHISECLQEEEWHYTAIPQDDFAAVKVKNSEHGASNPNARYAKVFTIEDVNASYVVADPLRLLEICSTSDGGAALVVSSLEYARSKGIKDPVKIAGISTVSPVYPNAIIDMPYYASDSWSSTGDENHTSQESDSSARI